MRGRTCAKCDAFQEKKNSPAVMTVLQPRHRSAAILTRQPIANAARLQSVLPASCSPP
jgi:hypothetical protein